MEGNRNRNSGIANPFAQRSGLQIPTSAYVPFSKREKEHPEQRVFEEGTIHPWPIAGTDDAYLDSLENMTAANNTEQNLIDLLTILYTNVANETELGSGDIDAIRDIAELCPYTDGFGVYMARGILLKYDTLLNNYINTCEYSPDPGSMKWDGNNGQTQQQLATESSLMFKLYPNPNNGQMVLEYDLADFTDAYLVFSNIYGQSVYNSLLKQGRNKIEVNLHELAAGMYLAKIISGTQSLHKEKLIILK